MTPDLKRQWARWELYQWANGQMFMTNAQLAAAIEEAIDPVPMPNTPYPENAAEPRTAKKF